MHRMKFTYFLQKYVHCHRVSRHGLSLRTEHRLLHRKSEMEERRGDLQPRGTGVCASRRVLHFQRRTHPHLHGDNALAGVSETRGKNGRKRAGGRSERERAAPELRL